MERGTGVGEVYEGEEASGEEKLGGQGILQACWQGGPGGVGVLSPLAHLALTLRTHRQITHTHPTSRAPVRGARELRPRDSVCKDQRAVGQKRCSCHQLPE